jgi:hypothetical protein
MKEKLGPKWIFLSGFIVNPLGDTSQFEVESFNSGS